MSLQSGQHHERPVACPDSRAESVAHDRCQEPRLPRISVEHERTLSAEALASAINSNLSQNQRDRLRRLFHVDDNGWQKLLLVHAMELTTIAPGATAIALYSRLLPTTVTRVGHWRKLTREFVTIGSCLTTEEQWRDLISLLERAAEIRHDKLNERPRTNLNVVRIALKRFAEFQRVGSSLSQLATHTPAALGWREVRIPLSVVADSSRSLDSLCNRLDNYCEGICKMSELAREGNNTRGLTLFPLAYSASTSRKRAPNIVENYVALVSDQPPVAAFSILAQLVDAYRRNHQPIAPMLNALLRLRGFHLGDDTWRSIDDFIKAQIDTGNTGLTETLVDLTTIFSPRRPSTTHSVALKTMNNSELDSTDKLDHLHALARIAQRNLRLEAWLTIDSAISYHLQNGLPLGRLLDNFQQIAAHANEPVVWKRYEAFFNLYRQTLTALDTVDRKLLSTSLPENHWELVCSLACQVDRQKGTLEYGLADVCNALDLLLKVEVRNDDLETFVAAIGSGHVRSHAQLKNLKIELAAGPTRYALLYVGDSPDTERLRELYRIELKSDSLANAAPLLHEQGKTAEKIAARAERCQVEYDQQLCVSRRLDGIHRGFSTFRYAATTHGGELPALLDQFGSDLSFDRKYVYARTRQAFPGPGFCLSGFDTARIFWHDPMRPDDPLHLYKQRWPIARSSDERSTGGAPIDDLAYTRVIFLPRALVFMPPAGEKYLHATFQSIPMSYIVYREGRQNVDGQRGGAIPTQVFRTLFSPTLTNSRHNAPRMAIDDCAIRWEDLVRYSRELGLPWANLGSGSTIGGGLLNALAPGSDPYFSWHRALTTRNEVLTDAWGYPHKSGVASLSHLDRHQRDDINSKMREGAAKLYALSTYMQNLADLVFVAIGRWELGDTVPRRGDDQSPANQRVGARDPDGDLLELNRFATRMMARTIKIHQLRQKHPMSQDKMPILCLMNAIEPSHQPVAQLIRSGDLSLPFLGGRARLSADSDGFSEEDRAWWKAEVVPVIRNSGLEYPSLKLLAPEELDRP